MRVSVVGFASDVLIKFWHGEDVGTKFGEKNVLC